MEVIGQLHTPATVPPVKGPPVHIRQEGCLGPRVGLDTGEDGKIAVSSMEPGPVATPRLLMCVVKLFAGRRCKAQA
jgi:hypothetical protein